MLIATKLAAAAIVESLSARDPVVNAYPIPDANDNPSRLSNIRLAPAAIENVYFGVVVPMVGVEALSYSLKKIATAVLLDTRTP